ncbi:MAG: hypothetical protein CL916_02270 [Deltaproteobacteria bacterium]|nr:hypothetical protein [Deltaproteobacteria bacterium]
MGYIVGIDVGSYEIKASLFEGSLGRYAFQKNISCIVLDGEEPLIVRQSQAKQKLIDMLPKDSRCFTAYPAEALSIKSLSLPFDDQTKVDQTLPFYIEDQIPFDIEDVVLANRIVNIAEGETELFLSVIPKEKLAAFLERNKEMDIDAEILPVDADVLSNSSHIHYEVILDIGHTRTLCVLCLEGKAILIRVLSRGMDSIIKNLAVQFPVKNPVSYLQNTELMAPNVLVEEDDAESTPDALIVQEFQKWSTGIRQLLISFEDQLDIEIQQVQICGGGSRIHGVEEYLHADLGVPVYQMMITETNETLNHFGLSYWIGQCAIGNTHGRELNLRTGEFSYKGNLERLGVLLKGAVLASVVLLGLGFAWFGAQYYQLNDERTQKNTELFSLFSEIMPEYPIPDDPDMVISLINTEKEEIQIQLESFERIFPSEPPILSKLKAFSEHLPSHSEARIDVSEMKFSKNSINVKAETDQFEQATSIVQGLKKYPLFAQAQKSDEKNVAKGVRFNIVIPLTQKKEEEN